MKAFTPVLAAAAFALSTTPALPQQASGSEALRFLNRLASHYLLLLTRSFVDLTYENIKIRFTFNEED